MFVVDCKTKSCNSQAWTKQEHLQVKWRNSDQERVWFGESDELSDKKSDKCLRCVDWKRGQNQSQHQGFLHVSLERVMWCWKKAKCQWSFSFVEECQWEDIQFYQDLEKGDWEWAMNGRNQGLILGRQGYWQSHYLKKKCKVEYRQHTGESLHWDWLLHW